MKVKIFSDTSYPRIENEINEWFEENESSIQEDFDIEFRVDTTHTNVIYTAIVLYDEA